MRAATAAIVGAIVGAAGCKSPPAAVDATAAAAAAAGTTATGPAPTGPTATATDAVTDAGPAERDAGAADALPPVRVHALLTAWLGNQNNGDLGAYEALYAAHVDAVVHAGPRRWRFDRKAWIANRSRVFRRAMEVGMSDLVVEVGRGSAVVTFAQTLHQGRLREDGTVQLVVVVEGEALRIAREEMIAVAPPPPPPPPSARGARRRGHAVRRPPAKVAAPTLTPDVAKAAPAPDVAAASPLHLVLDLDGGSYVVVAAIADATWGGGAARLASAPPAGTSHAALRAASALPPGLAAWRGRAVALLDAAGQRCDATVGELALMTAATLPAAEVAAWNPGGGRPAAPAALAEVLERLGRPPVLVGRLDGARCKPAVAVAAIGSSGGTAPAPTLLAASHDPALETRALAAARALPAYQRVQQAFARETHRAGPWAVAHASVYALGDRRFVSVEAAPASAASTARCGGFDAHVWALYEVDRTGLHLRNDPGADAFAPALFLDAGGLHVVGRDGGAAVIRSLGASGVRPVARLALPYLASDC